MMMELKRLYGLWQKMLLRLAFGYDWNKRILDKVPDEWKVFSGYQNLSVLSEQGLYFFLVRISLASVFEMDCRREGSSIHHKDWLYI